jgi:SP family general alpha glucoside:H+ symporter-like MFS transporter
MGEPEKYPSASSAVETKATMEGLSHDAETATALEKSMGVMESIRKYPKAVVFSMTLSLCVIMEGYDTSLLGNFYGLPQFRQRFGKELPDGDWQLTSSWQSGLQNGTQVGQILGLVFAGLIADRFGYRKTIAGALLMTIGLIFLFFFAQNIGMLFAAEFLCGLPWGAFQTLTTTYAADVTPIPLRPMLTTYVNMCWVIGQFLSAGILKGLLTRPGNWAWRIPYAIQWVFPPFIIVGVLLAPESPAWLVKKGRVEEARKALRTLTSPSRVSGEEIDKTVAMLEHTNALEKTLTTGTSYWDCVRGRNLRRTEVACFCWVSQVRLVQSNSIIVII